MVWRWDGEAFGATLANQDPDQDGKVFVYNLRFPGQYYDKSTGLHYNGFRDYDPSTGRYIESDPIGLAGGINTFGYVGGDPLGSIDSLGLKDQPYNPKKHYPRIEIPGTETPIFTWTSPEGKEYLIPPYDTQYNCHSDAWYYGLGDPKNYDNLRLWDNDVWDEMQGSRKLSNNEPNKFGDVVVYGDDLNGNGKLEQNELLNGHSALVVYVDNSGNATYVRSKEGQSRVTFHHPRQQHPEYGKFREYYRPCRCN